MCLSCAEIPVIFKSTSVSKSNWDLALEKSVNFGLFTTFILQEYVTPAAVAVIEAVPTLIPFIVPLLSTVTILLSLLDQDIFAFFTVS